MSVLAAAAAVGPATVTHAPPPVMPPYGMCGAGAGVGGARKRKDVVHLQEEAEEEGQGGEGGGGGHGLFVLETVDEEEEEREAEAEAERENERSSIGAVSDGEEEEEGDEAESKDNETPWQLRRKKKSGGLASLDALDDALPVKRGLSSFFSGKSRSFANLQEVAASTRSSKDVLAKPENPFNKRRRILRCCSIRRVSSTSLTALPPFLAPPEPSFNNIGNDGVINGGGGGNNSG